MVLTDVFECHQMVNEKNTFALEQFPDSLASFALYLCDPRRTWFTLTLFVLTSQHLTPVSVLSHRQQQSTRASSVIELNNTGKLTCDGAFVSNIVQTV